MRKRHWTEWIWGYGLRGLRARYRTGEVRYQWWPVRMRFGDRRMKLRHRLRYASLFNWHGIEEGFEAFPWPVPNARREVLPNPSWQGQHYERWRRAIHAQVWHIGPVLIICGEFARPVDSRLTDEHIQEIEHHGRTVA